MVDVEEYLYQLLNPNDKNVKEFVGKICNYWRSSKQQKTPLEEAKQNGKPGKVQRVIDTYFHCYKNLAGLHK